MTTCPRAAVAALATLCAVTSTSAVACEFYADGFQVVHPWTPSPAPADGTVAVFLTLAEIEVDDRLLGAESPVAGVVEIRAGFAPVATDGVRVGAGGARVVPVQLVLRGLVSPLLPGRQYPLSLRFERGGVVDVQFVVGAH